MYIIYIYKYVNNYLFCYLIVFRTEGNNREACEEENDGHRYTDSVGGVPAEEKGEKERKKERKEGKRVTGE